MRLKQSHGHRDLERQHQKGKGVTTLTALPPLKLGLGFLQWEKEPMVGSQHPPVPRYPTWVSLHKDHWGNLLGLTTEDQIETEKRGQGLQPLALRSWQSTFLWKAVPWLRSQPMTVHLNNQACDSTCRGSQGAVPLGLVYQPESCTDFGAHPMASPREGSKFKALPTAEYSFQCHSTRKSNQRIPTALELTLKQGTKPTVLPKCDMQSQAPYNKGHLTVTLDSLGTHPTVSLSCRSQPSVLLRQGAQPVTQSSHSTQPTAPPDKGAQDIGPAQAQSTVPGPNQDVDAAGGLSNQTAQLAPQPTGKHNQQPT